uniref:Venom phosphodiesterase 2-like n=1 Tax=Phallusia mammillata TaxID=59560 RepID=A0A6F9DCN4_9ASCI|nr:venom phosphodiesterase 2-like [Phallusia mammillata]
MRSVYPTKTFPNHYTIATGLYPESSGIVGNVMIDRVLRKKFRLGNQESFQPYWWKGEPIWVTASNQGLKSATYFWPGSDVNITRYPDYYFKYDGSVPNEERMYQALDWLDLPTGQRPSFITLYISILDSAGHKYGPVRSGFDKTLKTADTMVGILMNGLRDRGLLNCVNIIMLADHGMSPVKCSRLTSIEKFGVDASKYFVKSGSAGRVGSNLDPVAEASYNVTQVYEKLKCKRKEAHWQAFLKDEYLPKRFHYANNQRIDDVILLMDDTYLVEGKKGSYTKCDGGSHGFDPEFASMHALFAAHGPGFKQNYNSTEPFENIEVYNLMADLLNITAAPNNGTKGSMYHVMRSPPSLNLTFPVDGATGPCWVVPWESDCANCSKTNSTKVNQRLYLSDQQISSTLAKHLPLGVTKQPYTSDCFFYQQNYVTMLETPPQMPLFTSFVLNRSKPGLEVSEVCDRCDPRYHDEFVISKNFQNVATTTYLYQPGFTSGTEQNDASISTNRVPIYKNSVKIWNYMMETVGNWSYFHGETLVMLGPAFDYDHNGISDDYDLLACFRLPCDVIDAAPGIPMPTHYYIIVAYCSHSGMSIANCTSSPDDVEVLSFIIPNFKDKPCYAGDEPDEVWISQTVIEHVARVRDVELITDINFFEDWTTGPLADQNTATASVRLKNRLPQFTDKLLVDFVKISKNMSTQLKSTLFAFVVSVFASIVSFM